MLIFAGGQLLPGNVGRAMLGPFADQQAVEVLNHQMGTDRPLLVQYADWISGFVTGDHGQVLCLPRAGRAVSCTALLNSAKLALVAFLIVVPLGILGGVIAALYRGRRAGPHPLDRRPVGDGRAGVRLGHRADPDLRRLAALVPDLGHLGTRARARSTQLYHLILPSIPLVLILFGYIARMARAGMIEALDADYTRTAVLKGLTYPQVIWRHVLRNALLPTISVIATQTVYLIGGLVVIEILFHYQGIGSLIYTAAKKKDFPMLQAGVMAIGALFALTTLLADLLYAAP